MVIIQSKILPQDSAKCTQAQIKCRDNTAKKYKPLSDELIRLTEDKHVSSLSNGIKNSTYKNLLNELI